MEEVDIIQPSFWDQILAALMANPGIPFEKSIFELKCWGAWLLCVETRDPVFSWGGGDRKSSLCPPASVLFPLVARQKEKQLRSFCDNICVWFGRLSLGLGEIKETWRPCCLVVLVPLSLPYFLIHPWPPPPPPPFGLTHLWGAAYRYPHLIGPDRLDGLWRSDRPRNGPLILHCDVKSF